MPKTFPAGAAWEVPKKPTAAGPVAAASSRAPVAFGDFADLALPRFADFGRDGPARAAGLFRAGARFEPVPRVFEAFAFAARVAPGFGASWAISAGALSSRSP